MINNYIFYNSKNIKNPEDYSFKMTNYAFYEIYTAEDEKVINYKNILDNISCFCEIHKPLLFFNLYESKVQWSGKQLQLVVIYHKDEWKTIYHSLFNDVKNSCRNVIIHNHKIYIYYNASNYLKDSPQQRYKKMYHYLVTFAKNELSKIIKENNLEEGTKINWNVEKLIDIKKETVKLNVQLLALPKESIIELVKYACSIKNSLSFFPWDNYDKKYIIEDYGIKHFL